MIAVVSYGVGNVKSIVNMLARIGVDSCIATSSNEIARAHGVILPGVGAFDEAVRLLDQSGLRPALDEAVASGKPLLGICLGMQLLGRTSEEGQQRGLNWLPATTVRLHVSPDTPLPHMGWNWVEPTRPSAMFAPGDNDTRFYFLHSFAVTCDDSDTVLATAEYGGTKFVCAVQQDNVFGVQFHPEKSHKFGMRVLQRFAATA